MDYGALLPRRVSNSNKGSYGKVLMLAGSCGMAGAACFASEAAYRMGCGLVMTLSDPANRQILQLAVPEAIFRDYDRLEESAARANAAGAGPGLGTGEEAKQSLFRLLEVFSGPMVLDADALNLLSHALTSPDRREKAERVLRRGRLILTPHPGEMSRLTGESIGQICQDPERSARALAERYQLICVLKDAHTVITDGTRLIRNPSGCDGMATGGSGDVLTGMICALLAQGMEPFEAAALGVYLHGRAGEAAQRKLGARSMLARDLLSHIPEAILTLEKETPREAGVRS